MECFSGVFYFRLLLDTGNIGFPFRYRIEILFLTFQIISYTITRQELFHNIESPVCPDQISPPLIFKTELTPPFFQQHIRKTIYRRYGSRGQCRQTSPNTHLIYYIQRSGLIIRMIKSLCIQHVNIRITQHDPVDIPIARRTDRSVLILSYKRFISNDATRFFLPFRLYRINSPLIPFLGKYIVQNLIIKEELPRLG